MAIGLFFALLTAILAVLYMQDCHREWRLRQEESAHRLELAFNIVSRDLRRVREDAVYVASQEVISQFKPDEAPRRRAAEKAIASLLKTKSAFQQIRLIDLQGQELLRLEYANGESKLIPQDQLQDKSDRYYFQEAVDLKVGGVFVSRFDLNQEHGEIERPLNPVVRFITPVFDENETKQCLLVLNYRGVNLLNELSQISIPGETFLIRADGQYLLGPRRSDEWGWQLGHDRSFAADFPNEWSKGNKEEQLEQHSEEGAFAYRSLSFSSVDIGVSSDRHSRDQLYLVSHVNSEQVYESSNLFLRRQLLFSAVLFIPIFALSRLWAGASIRRRQQNLLIEESEKRLRELSSRLIRLQEDERRAISRELHDQLGQQVTAINLDLKLLQKSLSDISEQRKPQLLRAIDISDSLLASVHEFASRVRPVELDDLGLRDAVESHLQEFETRTGLEVVFFAKFESEKVSDVVAENVFRLIQEALNNVLKHAGASRVEVLIKTDANADGEHFLLKIQDNGIGVSQSSDPMELKEAQGRGRLGMVGMRERVELLGGDFSIESNHNVGTTIIVHIPLDC